MKLPVVLFSILFSILFGTEAHPYGPVVLSGAGAGTDLLGLGLPGLNLLPLSSSFLSTSGPWGNAYPEASLQRVLNGVTGLVTDIGGFPSDILYPTYISHPRGSNGGAGISTSYGGTGALTGAGTGALTGAGTGLSLIHI